MGGFPNRQGRGRSRSSRRGCSGGRPSSTSRRSVPRFRGGGIGGCRRRHRCRRGSTMHCRCTPIPAGRNASPACLDGQAPVPERAPHGGHAAPGAGVKCHQRRPCVLRTIRLAPSPWNSSGQSVASVPDSRAARLHFAAFTPLGVGRALHAPPPASLRHPFNDCLEAPAIGCDIVRTVAGSSPLRRNRWRSARCHFAPRNFPSRQGASPGS